MMISTNHFMILQWYFGRIGIHFFEWVNFERCGFLLGVHEQVVVHECSVNEWIKINLMSI